MIYPQAIRYLESFINYEQIPAYPYKESLKLERIKGFLDTIGNPQGSLKVLHVAGTKGKGSTCAFLTYILRQAGYRVGLYTSPHLADFRERIRILSPRPTSLPVPALPTGRRQAGRLLRPKEDFEGMITESELAQLVERLKPAIDKYNRESKYGPLSFFEVYTALAFLYFKEKEVDFAVLETGLGGRLDATNIAEPLVCGITSISYEHTQKLGNTLAEIAAEKAGIIKSQKLKVKSQKLIVISAPQEKEARDVIRNRCNELGAELYEVGKDIFYEKIKSGFKIKGLFAEYSDLKINLIGDHQLVNATTAVGIIEALQNYNIMIDADSIRGGLYNTLWPGRCEVISENPLIVLDGAQNTASAEVIKQAIRENFQYHRLILVLGISNDKDIKGICGQLKDLADEVVLTRAGNPRAAYPEELARYFSGDNIIITDNIKEARQKVLSRVKEGDLILVTGSLFVVGEFRNGKIQSQ